MIPSIMLFWLVLFITFLIVCNLCYLVVKYHSKSRNVRFLNKHILITGGSKGIGFAIARKLAPLDVRITLMARNMVVLRQSAFYLQDLPNTKAHIRIWCGDVTTSIGNLVEAFNHSSRTVGPVDILINCAGEAKCGTFDELPIDEHFLSFDINYFGSLKMTKLVLDMNTKINRKTTIVYLSSIAGVMGIHGYSTYSPAKFALAGLCQVLSMEYSKFDVNFIMAYPFDTETPGYCDENKTKPPLTKLISGSGGLWNPDDVAERIIRSIETNDNVTYFGFSGLVVYLATCGAMLPGKSVIRLIMSIFASGIFRLILLIQITIFHFRIRRYRNKSDVKNS